MLNANAKATVPIVYYASTFGQSLVGILQTHWYSTTTIIQI
jgi:hypothetical protein